MQAAPIKPHTGPAPAKLPELDYPADVVARMKATGVDPVAAQQRLAGLPRDEAETTWANVTDYYRRNTDASSRVAAYQGADKTYQKIRSEQPVNAAWTGWNDLGSSFKNSFLDLAQGVADFVPSTVDLAMSATSSPDDTSWYRKWDAATDRFFDRAKYYVSPEAQAAVWDDKTGLNWKAVAGMTGNTLGFLTTTMIPLVGQVGRIGQAAQGATLVSRMLTDPRIQSGAIGYLQAMPGYKEAALQAGYTRNQAALIAPVLSTAQSVLEFAGADALIKTARLAPAEAMAVVRQLGKESATDAFKSLSGKALTEESFKDVINATGKGFFSRLKLPEVRQAIFQNIKAGAASEGLEELTQQAAESAIQKMADTYYGNDAPGGKGFDPTLKQTLIQAATGVLMGGIVGGSMGGMLGRTPTSVGQQTVWGALDNDVRNFLGRNPGQSLAENRDSLDIYRIADRAYQEGKLSDTEYQNARAGLDDMVRIAERLAPTNSDAPTRYAMYNLDSQQRQWQSRIEREVGAPMQRLSELTNVDEQGTYRPKPELYQAGRAADLFEATSLIEQNLSAKAQLGGQIQQTINTAITGLSSTATRAQTLKSYQPTLDALADQWENGVVSEPDAPVRPDQYTEDELPGLYRTMDTPDGRFALADMGGSREVFRVESQTEGAQTGVSEDTDPTIGRFKGYKLPSKGKPVVRLRTMADQTRHDELLNAFDANSDVTEDYTDWRTRLSDGYEDNELDGLRQAEASYQQEAANLPADAPDWQKQDLARKRNWLKGALASRAADSSESRYSQSDWIANYLSDELAQANIDPDTLQTLPPDTQSAITDALQSGDFDTASQLATTPNDTLPDTPEPAELSARYAAATERARLLSAATAATQQVLERAAVVEEFERLLNAGQLTADTEQQFMDAVSELARALDAESAAIAALDSAESGVGSGLETGVNSPQAGVGNLTSEQTDAGQPLEGEQESGQSDVVEIPAKRTENTEPKVIVRQAQDIREAILQYFTAGGKMRRSDFARYADANLMKGSKGGNPYVGYLTKDDKSPSLDTLAHAIIEDELGEAVHFDEQAAMQQIVDTLQSFSTNGAPRQQLIAYQQAGIQAELAQQDSEVAQATAQTPLEALEPLMAGMDRAGLPAELQDDLVNIVANNYVSSEGLDWTGVVHLLRANDLFETYENLHNSLLPYLSEIIRQIPTSNQQVRVEVERMLATQQADLMSNDWWQQMAAEQALTDEAYNNLINDIYGDSTRRVQTTGDFPGALGESQAVSTDEEGTRLFSQGDSTPGESGAIPAEAGYVEVQEAVALSADQQARIIAAQTQYDSDIARLERDNTRLANQADKLRSELKSRSKTGDLFAQPAAPFNPDNKPAYFARVVDVPGGFSAESVLENPARAAVYEIVPISANEAIYRVATDANAQNLALSDTYSYLNDGTTYVNPPDANATIVTTEPGTLTRNRNSWQITKKAVVRFDTGNGQLDLTKNSTTGLDAQGAAAEKLADIQSQIEANTEQIKNLQANRERIAEIAMLAPQQAALFSQGERNYASIDPSLHAGLLARLRETFAGIADDVRILDSAGIQAAAEIETGSQLKAANGTVYGFTVGDTLYLNGDVLNANTPIHEFGHVWNRWVKTNRPDLYSEGIAKARANAAYYDAVASDVFYQQQADRMGLTGEARAEYFAEEALATAIGDQGERFVSEATRKGFLGWLDRLWSAIKDKLGIENRSAAEIADMDLQEFAGGVAARLLEGRRLEADLPVDTQSDSITRFSYGPPPSPTDQPARPIQNGGAKMLSSLADSFKKNAPERAMLLAQSPAQLADYLKQTFEPMIKDVLSYSENAKIINQLTKVRANGQALVDVNTGEINPQVLAALSFELTANKPKSSEATGRLRDLLWYGSDSPVPDVLTAYKENITKSAIIDEDGNYEWPDVQREIRDTTASIDALTGNGNDGQSAKLLKGLLTSKWLGNVLNVETVGGLLSLGDSSVLSRITKDIRRVWVSRAAEVRLRRNHIVNELIDDLKGLSRFASPGGNVGDIRQVKTYSLPGWQDGTATTIDLPIGDWLDMYFTIKTQLTTTGKLDPAKATSSALAEVVNGQFVSTRVGLNNNNQAQGGSYGYQYTPPGEEKPRTLLIDRNTYNQLEVQLQAEHGDIIEKVERLFADPVARAYVSDLFEIEQGKELALEDNYYPTQEWTNAAERNAVSDGNVSLENAQFLQERTAPPLLVTGRDLLARINTYTSTEHRYIANSATRLNLANWRMRNAKALKDAPTWLTKYLISIEQDLNSNGGVTPNEDPLEFEVAGVDLGLRAWMRRFSRSTFAFSLTTGPKQLLTHLNAYGLGIIENQYLRQSASDLGKLAVDSYKLAKQSSQQSLFGGELVETAYLNELAQNPYMATIMDRLTGQDESYLGRPTIEDIKAQPLNGTIAYVRSASHSVADVGLRWVRASDRAVILSFWKAAQYQVSDKVATGQLKDGAGNPITDVNSDAALREIARLTEELTYATNTMSGEGDATPLQRNKGLAGAMLGLYSGQQQKLVNTCVKAVNDYLKARAVGDPMVDELRGRAIWTSANLLLFNAVGVGMVNLLYKMLSGLLTGEEPKEDVLTTLSWDVGRGLLGSVPSVPTELLIAASTWVDGPRWGEDVLGYAPGQSFERVVEGMVSAKDYIATDDPEVAAKRWNTLTYNLIDGGAHLAGLPVQVPKLLSRIAQDKPVKETDWSGQ